MLSYHIDSFCRGLGYILASYFDFLSEWKLALFNKNANLDEPQIHVAFVFPSEHASGFTLQLVHF